MVTNIAIERTGGLPLENQSVEIVERKGTGHPDFMADSIAETYSRNLSRYYLDNFGTILHHNVDKLEVIGGQTSPEFGGGRVLVPVSILFSGRATDRYGDVTIPVREIAISSACEFIDSRLRYLDSKTVRYLFETKPGAANLSNVYRRGGILSNDTSFGAGYAPLTPAESAVLQVEKRINSTSFKKEYPYSGEDVKVLATRKKSHLEFIIANAFVDRFIDSVENYFSLRSELADIISNEISEMLPEEMTFDLTLNGMDDRAQGKDGCYLTVTGTSAEHGDDGSVGRGNRANGLITPNRVMSFEAIAGKNPVNHIGKIYGILSFQIAQEINSALGTGVSVKIVGRIGDPVDNPRMVSITTHERISMDERRTMTRVAEERLAVISEITGLLVEGKIDVC